MGEDKWESCKRRIRERRKGNRCWNEEIRRVVEKNKECLLARKRIGREKERAGGIEKTERGSERDTEKEEKERSRIRAVQMDNLRGVLGVRRMDRVPNARIRELCRVAKVVEERIEESGLACSKNKE